MKCYYCGKEVPETAEKCPACYCPLQGGKKEAYEFAQSQQRIVQLEAEESLEQIAKGRYVFYGIAALFLLQTILVFGRGSYGENTWVMGITGAVVTVVFAAFGFFLRRNPIVFSIIGFACSFLFFGSIAWIISALAMGLCIYFSYNYMTLQKRLKEIQCTLDRLSD